MEGATQLGDARMLVRFGSVAHAAEALPAAQAVALAEAAGQLSRDAVVSVLVETAAPASRHAPGAEAEEQQPEPLIRRAPGTASSSNKHW